MVCGWGCPHKSQSGKSEEQHMPAGQIFGLNGMTKCHKIGWAIRMWTFSQFKIWLKFALGLYPKCKKCGQYEFNHDIDCPDWKLTR
jgi:hypothetical protein